MNTKQVNDAIAAKMAAIKLAVARGTTKAAFLVQGTARKKILNGPKTGIVYERGKVSHTASAPGEAPANDTGNLARAVNVVAAEPSLRAIAKVEVDTPYALALEFGRLDGSIEPRPFLQPAADEKATACRDLLQAEVAQAIAS